MHRGVLAAGVACRRYPELLDKLAPAGALARMTDERLQREHASPQRFATGVASGRMYIDHRERETNYGTLDALDALGTDSRRRQPPCSDQRSTSCESNAMTVPY